MRTQPVLVPLAVLLFSVGCSQTIYVKDGSTAQQFEADKFDCEQKVITMYGGYAQMGLGHAIMARGDIGRCLLSKGYRESSSTGTTPPSGSHLTPQETARISAEINKK